MPLLGVGFPQLLNGCHTNFSKITIQYHNNLSLKNPLRNFIYPVLTTWIYTTSAHGCTYIQTPNESRYSCFFFINYYFYLCLLLPLLKRKQQKMLWSIFQHWRDVETSVWYRRICADSVQSATTQGDRPTAVSVRNVCYHIDYDLEKLENITELKNEWQIF